MASLPKLNKIRKKLTHALTGGIGSSNTEAFALSSSKVEIRKILICRPNHRLGNLLLVSPLIQEIQATFPESRIDLFVQGSLASILFRNYENIDRIIQLPRKPFSLLPDYLKGWLRLRDRSYDLIINVEKSSSSGRLSTWFARGEWKIYGEAFVERPLNSEDQVHYGKGPVCVFRTHLNRIGSFPSRKEYPAMDIKLSPSELAEGKQLLQKLGFNGQKTICLFTYATGAKCYSASWWTHFYNGLKTEFPNYQFLEVLPVENVSQLSFSIPVFYSKEVRQIGALIASSRFFIGADCGITHLATAVRTPSIALFSVTDEKKYGPYCNNSCAVNTNTLEEEDIYELMRSILTNSSRNSEPATETINS